MSASFGLVKFKRTGNIYYGCYEGTSDVMNPFLCAPEECYNRDEGYYAPIEYCRYLSIIHRDWKFPANIIDLDQVEIYSDYGGGFYWSGTGSESVKMIKETIPPWDDIYDGKLEWVDQFLDKENIND